jgi:ElaB/YqjD/DUF883 family membrane-anchored ribosome-binding protein
MKVTRKLVTSFLVLALLFAEACTKKRPSLPQQAQPQAPTIAEALPDEIPEKTEPPPPPPQLSRKETEQPKKQQKKPVKGTTKKTTPPASPTVAGTPPAAPAQPPAQTPPPQNAQTVASVRPEPAPEMTVAAAISSKDANKQKEDTAHMVEATENALKTLTRPLNDEEKGMRTQVETYLQQSRKATTDGDYERAFYLAKKAQVLAEALVKP